MYKFQNVFAQRECLYSIQPDNWNETKFGQIVVVLKARH